MPYLCFKEPPPPSTISDYYYKKMKMTDRTFSFQYDFVKLPETFPVETKKGGIQPTRITEELFRERLETGASQHSWQGSHKIIILVFDPKARAARVQLDYTMSVREGQWVSEAAWEEIFRSSLAIYCDCGDKYNEKTKETDVFVTVSKAKSPE
jgi:hypothetical protein